MKNDTGRLLLIDPDVTLGHLLHGYLASNAFTVDYCAEVSGAGEFYREKSYDLCILEINLPDDQGFQLLQDIREHSATIPLLVVSDRDAHEDVIRAFLTGCDDYVVKPFNIEELILRIKALLRRVGVQRKIADEKKTFQIGDYEFDTIRQTLRYKDGPETRLTTKESELLMQLALNMNQVLTRESALKSVWSDYNYFNARSMDVYITKLRKHLQNDDQVEILNVRGRGFKLIG